MSRVETHDNVPLFYQPYILYIVLVVFTHHLVFDNNDGENTGNLETSDFDKGTGRTRVL